MQMIRAGWADMFAMTERGGRSGTCVVKVVNVGAGRPLRMRVL